MKSVLKQRGRQFLAWKVNADVQVATTVLDGSTDSVATPSRTVDDKTMVATTRMTCDLPFNRSMRCALSSVDVASRKGAHSPLPPAKGHLSSIVVASRKGRILSRPRLCHSRLALRMSSSGASSNTRCVHVQIGAMRFIRRAECAVVIAKLVNSTSPTVLPAGGVYQEMKMWKGMAHGPRL